MKITFGVCAALILVSLLLFAAPKFLESAGRKQVPEMTPATARQLFEQVGGINIVSQEAKTLLSQLGTNDWSFLNLQDLRNTPAISSLYSTCKNYSGKDYSGTSVAVSLENGRHIEIKFGNHWSLKRFYIFDPDAPQTFSPPSNWFQVSSNIFASR
jgi:hypothetical protein